jgi:hypothetical protein
MFEAFALGTDLGMTLWVLGKILWTFLWIYVSINHNLWMNHMLVTTRYGYRTSKNHYSQEH